MKVLTTRTSRVVVASVIQLALVAVAVAAPLSARLTGKEYLLEVEPVDPVDPFRGAYVALAYPGLPNGEPLVKRPDAAGEIAFIPLVTQGEIATGRAPVAEPPESGPFLRCKDERWRLRCGIESWFLPQEKALATERAVRDGRAVARIRVDSRGNAALIGVEIRGTSSARR